MSVVLEEVVDEELDSAPVLASTDSQTRVRPEKIRLSLDITPAMKDVIEQLAHRDGLSQSDVLRRALGLYKVIKEAEDSGESPALVNREGRVTSRLVGI